MANIQASSGLTHASGLALPSNTMRLSGIHWRMPDSLRSLIYMTSVS